ncbi:MAG: ABC transporter ATP-binding protein [Bdellovibrionales bacterium]|jgi:putative ABC transport system ATP-binding protein|nr:ABC transporter ATP-binding protein [Bdellovibrionales bacterium]MBP9709248.1 ABC transporter ATP-binding protein [Oligoflexales bacterium]
MIELKNVSKTYKTGKTFVQALKSVNFSIHKSDFVLIRGPSGSGKSTLLNIVGLLDNPSEGEILLNGKPVSFDDFDKLATLRSKTISFIFQSFNLNPVLTLEENVMVPLMIRTDLTREEKKRRVSDWIKKTGLYEHRHHRPDELSGGQRQRVAIARAMVTEPELVIADEPTANLDSKTARSILEFMKQLNQEKKVTFLFATHDPVLDEFAKTHVEIKDGVLTITGTNS